MRPLRGELLVEAWEAGFAKASLARALGLLAAADESRAWEELMTLSMAERDLELLRLRQASFGDLMKGSLPCGACGTRLEFGISVQRMIERFETLRRPAEATVAAGRFTFVMRPVNSRDLAAIVSETEPRRELLALCTSLIEPGGVVVQDAVVACEERVTEQFNWLNEGAETRFSVPCMACGVSGQVDLDIARFLWTEVRHAALTILREVHELASAYGWAERAIFAMSAARRSAYLEMARA